MHTLLIAVGGIFQLASQDAFLVHCNLQGMYDEISNATMASRTARDIDMFHTVFYTTDWAFVDADGRRHAWDELRAEAIRALDMPRADAIRQAIQGAPRMRPDGAVVLVHAIVIRTVADDEGRYGLRGGSHTLAEVTTFSDTWLGSGDTWKLQRREQVGAPAVYVDKMPPDIENPRCPSTN